MRLSSATRQPLERATTRSANIKTLSLSLGIPLQCVLAAAAHSLGPAAVQVHKQRANPASSGHCVPSWGPRESRRGLSPVGAGNGPSVLLFARARARSLAASQKRVCLATFVVSSSLASPAFRATIGRILHTPQRRTRGVLILRARDSCRVR